MSNEYRMFRTDIRIIRYFLESLYTSLAKLVSKLAFTTDMNYMNTY